MDTTNQTVLITGGAAGIGLALARRFHAAGNRVIVTGRDQARLAEAQARLPGLVAEIADMADQPALDRLAAAYPETTILINNAGVQHNYALADPSAPLDLVAQELQTNLIGPIYLTRRMLPQLLSKPSAAIVNVSSGLAFAPKQSAPVYCASKAAIHSFSTTLRWQLEPTAVKVFEIIPALVDTAMTAGRGSGKITPEALVDEFWAAFASDRYEIRIGKVKQLMLLRRLLPGLAERMMRGA
jgi:uncharacterized oxidoreductase